MTKKLTKKDVAKAKKRFQNRNVTKAKNLYLYLMGSGVFMLAYLVVFVVFDVPFMFLFTPIILIGVYFAFLMVKKNWKLICLFIRDVEQGKFMLFLNENTHWSDDHKMKVVNWVYLRNKTIRSEYLAELTNKAMNGIELSKEEKLFCRYKTVFCPQQILDGFNRAMLVNALIYAHVNIHLLDHELRNIMELTDENMVAFDISVEIDKCRKK